MSTNSLLLKMSTDGPIADRLSQNTTSSCHRRLNQKILAKLYLGREWSTQLRGSIPSSSDIILQYAPKERMKNLIANNWTYKNSHNYHILYLQFNLLNKNHITVQNIAVGSSLNATLANPKSQILSLQFAFASIFLGLRSLWYTFAVTIHKII